MPLRSRLSGRIMHLSVGLLWCVVIVAVTGHCRIKHPRPLAAAPDTPAGNYYNNPLRPDGSEFPCKGLHKKADVDKTPTETWQPGQQTRFEILGHGISGGEGSMAAHSGGSCQASISFDDGDTWKVLHSYIGGCPRGARLGSNIAGNNQTFHFLVPENTRAGNALFSWTWIAVTGNRNELYQNCASIRIAGSGTSTLDDFPDMFVGDLTLTGHIGAGECRSFSNNALEYPNPGEAVTKTSVPSIPFKKPTDGKCYSKRSSENSTTTNPSSSGKTTTTKPTTTTTVKTTTTKPTTTTTVKTTTTKPTTTVTTKSTSTKASTTPPKSLSSTVSGAAGALPAQCSGYTVITDETRRSTHKDAIGCDKSVLKAELTWVRFSGAAGTRLAPGPMEPFRCGTQGTGWYKGTYPTVIGQTTTGTVCYSWPNNNCQWSNSVSITNCNGFYVFSLPPPPACYLRYCTV